MENTYSILNRSTIGAECLGYRLIMEGWRAGKEREKKYKEEKEKKENPDTEWLEVREEELEDAEIESRRIENKRKVEEDEESTNMNKKKRKGILRD